MEYEVLVGASPNLLETMVNMRINSGWRLIGGASVAMDSYGTKSFLQTVIKGDYDESN